MTLSEALIDDLTLLSDALEDPIVDLNAVLSVLTDDLTAAIPRYLGLSVNLQVGGSPVTVLTLEPVPPAEIWSSVSLTLLPLAETSATGSVVFYSGVSGAFVDLAEDAKWIFNLDGYPTLDQDLVPPPSPASTIGIAGLIDLSDINQAVGCLIEEGHTLVQAQEELRRLADLEGHSQAETARRILAAIEIDPEIAPNH